MPGAGLQPIEVQNTGENRLCCFDCDFSICAKCVEFLDSSVASDKIDKMSDKQRNVSEVPNGIPWNGEGSLVRTISREVDKRKRVVSSHQTVQRTSITQVRPQH